MTSHFLLSSAARTLSLASVARMSDEEAEKAFIRLRWSDNDGNAYCPHCGCAIVYSCRRPNGAPRWRCKACRKDFSVTSRTLFAFHKLPLRSYLMAIAIFCNEVKGKSMLALSRDLGTQYKTAFEHPRVEPPQLPIAASAEPSPLTPPGKPPWKCHSLISPPPAPPTRRG